MSTPITPRGVGYVGRFAPSPTGLLHFGSLIAAVASYLDAKANHGLWKVRIEDLDPPREQPGASSAILQTLSDHGFQWDGAPLYQSSRQHAYQQVLQQLIDMGYSYPCQCSRKQILQRSGASFYDGHCRPNSDQPAQPPKGDHAWRLNIGAMPTPTASERIQPDPLWQQDQLQDVILKRRDGLFAYQLAVVVDDEYQQISHIVRGSDLAPETAAQRMLQTVLGYTEPSYAHLPVVVGANGQKLSKQSFAKPLESGLAIDNLLAALTFLRQPTPSDAKLRSFSPAQLLDWAAARWQPDEIPKQLAAPLPVGIFGT